jgi:hypothetical protein
MNRRRVYPRGRTLFLPFGFFRAMLIRVPIALVLFLLSAQSTLAQELPVQLAWDLRIVAAKDQEDENFAEIVQTQRLLERYLRTRLETLGFEVTASLWEDPDRTRPDPPYWLVTISVLRRLNFAFQLVGCRSSGGEPAGPVVTVGSIAEPADHDLATAARELAETLSAIDAGQNVKMLRELWTEMPC